MSWSPGRCCEVCLTERQVKNCYCLIAFRGGSSGSRTGYPAAISNRSRHAMIHAFKVQRRSAVGRSRAGQRSGVVRARPARRHRVVVSVDVSGRATASLGWPSLRPALPDLRHGGPGSNRGSWSKPHHPGASRATGRGVQRGRREGDLFVPNADTGSRLLTPGAVAYRLACVFLLVRLGA